MKKSVTFLIFILSTNLLTTAQTIKIYGKLYDKNGNEPISNGVLFLNPGNLTTISNPYGEYSFTTSPGIKQITTQVMGYKPATVSFELKTDTIINIYLQVSLFEINAVTIIGDSIKNMEPTSHGSFIITPTALREIPKLFGEPDLLKSFQQVPGVVPGKDGSADIYVRGGGMGQNIILANGCYFFLPGHLLGFTSPFDIDFLESAELFKDYFPPELGGGASSIISLNFKKPRSDSLEAQLRLGLLSSGINVELPVRKIKWDLTAGLKRGNYSIYAPFLKKIVNPDVGDNLPPENYSYYDGFLRLSHNSSKWGNITYLFFGNYDNGKDEKKTTSRSADTLIHYTDGISTGWNNMVHAFQWNLPVNKMLKWKFSLNYNRLTMGREIYMQTDRFINETDKFESRKVTYSFSPVINNISSNIALSIDGDRFQYSAGLSNRFKFFAPNNIATHILNDTKIINEFGETGRIIEPTAFISSGIVLTEKILFNAGFRLSCGFTQDAEFFVFEPRLRLIFFQGRPVSPHINYVRLSQFDHSVEGSNAGLRSLMWLPVLKDFGPEISDVLSAGFQGQINNNFVWTLDGYYKKITGMVDFKPGASFIFDTSFVDILDRIDGKAYGLETGIIKRKGKLTGSASYTYSRSKREWSTPEGMIWIPSNADRPHHFNLTLKYYFKAKTSFGLNWIYTSGAPATIYMHNTSYGEWFETKNNIRYFNYHRLDLSFRQVIFKRKISVLLDIDVYNVYNRKNTFYFKQIFDEIEKRYYFKNISLFPVMPSLSLTIKY